MKMGWTELALPRGREARVEHSVVPDWATRHAGIPLTEVGMLRTEWVLQRKSESCLDMSIWGAFGWTVEAGL